MTAPKDKSNESDSSTQKPFAFYLSKILHSHRTGLSKKDDAPPLPNKDKSKSKKSKF